MTVELARRLFTVDEYHRMAEVGILTRRDRVELIDGEIRAVQTLNRGEALRSLAFPDVALIVDDMLG